MNREVLQKYFRKECSESEAAKVEEWLLDPEHQQELNRFLEEEWDHHVTAAPLHTPVLHPASKRKASFRRYLPRFAAAAAVLALVTFTAIHYLGKAPVEQAAGNPTTIAETRLAPEPTMIDSGAVTEKIKQQRTAARTSTKTIRHGQTNAPVPASTPKRMLPADTVPAVPEKPGSMKAATFNKVIINEVALNKLDSSQRLTVLNQMLTNLNFNNASFPEIMALFRDKYGIQIELCATAKPGVNKFTASYSNITFSDLMNQMSKQMLFSYTFADNKVKVCFN